MITKKLEQIKRYLWNNNDHTDTSNIQHSGNQKDNANSTSPTTNEPISDTPFRIIGTDKGWFVAMGNHRLTDLHEKKSDALELVFQMDWNFVINVMSIVSTETTKFNNGQGVTPKTEQQ